MNYPRLEGEGFPSSPKETLMARGGMRIGEVLKLTPKDIEDRKLILRSPKSGKEREIVFTLQKDRGETSKLISAQLSCVSS